MDPDDLIGSLKVVLSFPGQVKAEDALPKAERLTDDSIVPVLEKLAREYGVHEIHVDQLTLDLGSVTEGQLPSALEASLRDRLDRFVVHRSLLSEPPSVRTGQVRPAGSEAVERLYAYLVGLQVPWDEDILNFDPVMLFDNVLAGLQEEQGSAGIRSFLSSLDPLPFSRFTALANASVRFPDLMDHVRKEDFFKSGRELSAERLASWKAYREQWLSKTFLKKKEEKKEKEEVVVDVEVEESKDGSTSRGKEVPLSDHPAILATEEGLTFSIDLEDESSEVSEAQAEEWTDLSGEKAEALPHEPESQNGKELDSPSYLRPAEAFSDSPEPRPESLPDGVAFVISEKKPFSFPSEGMARPSLSKQEDREDRGQTSIREPSSVLDDETSRIPSAIPPSGEGTPIPSSVWDTAREEAEEVLEKLPLSDAGLVLVHPFIPRFLQNLELIDDRGKFVSGLAKVHAVHLLRHITGFKGPHFDHCLFLEKALCGLPPGYLIPVEWKATEREEEETAAMLSSLLSYWPTLRKSSVEALQHGFLQRGGSLGKEEGNIVVQVEESAMDILLQDLPWELSIIMLPWLEQPLWVDWRR